MSSIPTSATQIAIFGDLEADLWGVVIGGQQPRVLVAGLTDADLALQPGELDLEDGETWALVGGGSTLRIELADATAATPKVAGALESCRVSGSAQIGETEREFDVGGVRSAQLTTADAESLRLVGTWFPAGHEISLLSARPRGAVGHDRDAVSVVARGEEHPLVIDPRLSTTYDEHGDPHRFGVELWLGDDPDGEQWPRRVAGAMTGSRITDSAGDALLSAYATRCVSRAEAGAGVYVLARPA
jgi:hypothetical protein